MTPLNQKLLVKILRYTPALILAFITIAMLMLSQLSFTGARSVSDSQNGHSRRFDRNMPQPQPLAAPQNRCQSGWMWYNNKCWVTTQSRRDFVHAMELCKKMYNSTLPTIHSEEENEFLSKSVDLSNSPIWLYARHNHQYNKTRWLDKSDISYTNWDSGQPSDKSSLVCIKTNENWYMKKAEPKDGQTECVTFWEDSKWGTQVGCLVLLPVVCERKLTPVSRLIDGPNGGISSGQESTNLPLSSANHLQIVWSDKLNAVLLIVATLFARYHVVGSSGCDKSQVIMR